MDANLNKSQGSVNSGQGSNSMATINENTNNSPDSQTAPSKENHQSISDSTIPVASPSSYRGISLPAPVHQQVHSNYETGSRSFFDGNVSTSPSSSSFQKEQVDPNEPAASAGGFSPSVLHHQAASNHHSNTLSQTIAEPSNNNYQGAPSNRGGQQQSYGNNVGSSSSGYQQAANVEAPVNDGYDQYGSNGQQTSYGSSSSGSGQSNEGYPSNPSSGGHQQQGNGVEDGYVSSGPSTSVLAQQAANQVSFYHSREFFFSIIKLNRFVFRLKLLKPHRVKQQLQQHNKQLLL